MKEIINDAAFRKKLEQDPVGGYLFFGDEDYLKAHSLNAARQLCCPDPSMAIFNDMTVDASSSDNFIDSLASAIAAAPMMDERKCVTLSGLDVSALTEKELDALCAVAATIEEFDYNLLIISVPSGMIEEGNLPRRPSAVLNKLCEHLTPVHFPKVPAPKLASWIVRHFAHHGVRVEEGVPNAIITRCGSDMFTLAGEIEKLSFYVLAASRDSVSLDDVPLVTCPNEEFDAFALGTAVAERNSARALDILALMKARRVEPVVIMGELSSTLGNMLAAKILTGAHKNASEIAAALKIHEYTAKLAIGYGRNLPLEDIRRAVRLCAEADAALKLSPTGYVEIEKLICSL